MHSRPQDWQIRLDAFIEERRCRPFAWGSQDCCQFARAAVHAFTGRDLTENLKLRLYKTERGAKGNLIRLARRSPELNEMGLGALPGLAGLPEISITLAGRGDLMLFFNQGREALGICVGKMSAGAGPLGLIFLPTLECRRAWRV